MEKDTTSTQKDANTAPGGALGKRRATNNNNNSNGDKGVAGGVDSTNNRRQKENQTYIDMAESIPLPEKDTKDLDRASVLRVTIGYVKLRESVNTSKERTKHRMEVVAKKVKGIGSLTDDMFKALDGFLLVISSDGLITFASESVADHLGLREVDVMGHNIRDLVHPQDFMEVAHIFANHDPLVKPDLEQEFFRGDQKHFVVRMRSTFSASVRSITRCASFKPIYCSAKITYQQSTNPLSPYKQEISRISVVCRVASTVDLRDLCIGSCVMTKHDMSYNCIYVDNKMKLILGYDPADMINSNAFVFFHPGDLSDEHAHAAHMETIQTGQNKSPAFRAMTKWGTWVWVRAMKQCLYDPATHQPVGLAIYSWLIGPAGAIECNKAFLKQYGSDHLPNAKEQFKSVLGSSFNPDDCYNPNYVPFYPKQELPAHPPTTSKVEAVKEIPTAPQPPLSSRSHQEPLAPQQMPSSTQSFQHCSTELRGSHPAHVPPPPSQPQMTHTLPPGPPLMQPTGMTHPPSMGADLANPYITTHPQQPVTLMYSQAPATFGTHHPPTTIHSSLVTNEGQPQLITQQVFSPPLTPPESSKLPVLPTDLDEQGHTYPLPCTQSMGSTILSPPVEASPVKTSAIFSNQNKDYYVQNSCFNMTPSPSGSDRYSHSSFSPLGNGIEDGHTNHPPHQQQSYADVSLQQNYPGCYSGSDVVVPEMNRGPFVQVCHDGFSNSDFESGLGGHPPGSMAGPYISNIHSSQMVFHSQVGFNTRQPYTTVAAHPPRT